jgi:hypothetical protein
MSKKIFTLVFLLTIALSCKKEKKYCWTCSYGTSFGCPPRPPDNVCSDREDFITNGWNRPKDCNGGDLPYGCVPR